MAGGLSNPPTRRNRRKHPGFSDINVTPMVDVMLVLLVIFMVTAPMLTAGVDVTLPSSNASPLPDKVEPLTVSIRRDGSVYLQKTRVVPEELGPKIRAIVGEKDDTRIFIRGDAGVDYGRVMQVMGEINAAGLSKVALITDPNAPISRGR